MRVPIKSNQSALELCILLYSTLCLRNKCAPITDKIGCISKALFIIKERRPPPFFSSCLTTFVSKDLTLSAEN